MQQQFTKIAQLVLAIIAVATIASLATAVVMLSRSEDGAADSSLSRGALGAQLGEVVARSARGELKEHSTVVLVTRGERGRIEGVVYLRTYVNEQGKVSLESRAEMGGLPIGEYGLWLEPPENFQEAGMQPRLLQTGMARDVLELRRDTTQFPLSLTELPVTVRTLEGFTLSIRQKQDGIGPASFAGPVLLSRPIPRTYKSP